MPQYRIHFLATFDRVIEADDGRQAIEIAHELQATTTIPHPGGAVNVACQWNHIELIKEAPG